MTRSSDEKVQKKAHTLLSEYVRLKERVEQGGRSSPLAERRLETLVIHMTKQKEVMASTREHDPVMAKEITERARGIQLEKTRERGGREIEF
jgi:hypothetical protein